MVPKEWEIKTLEQAKITVTDGDRGKEYPKSSEFYDSGYCLFLSAKNVTKKGFSFLDKQFISEEKHKKLRKGVVKKDDIVLTTRGSVGQFAYYDHTVNFENIRINSGMVTLGCSKSELESDFFYALSKSSLMARQIDSAAFGSAQPQLTVKIIKSLKLPVPPIPEQQKIAKILSTWDKAIGTTERLIDNSIQQKKALMQQLLTGKKRLLDELGQQFAGEWEELELGHVTKIYDGTHSTPKYVEQGIPFYSVEHLTRNDFSSTKYISEEVYEKENKRVKLEKNDILMTRIGDIGTAKCLTWDVKASFYVSLALIKSNCRFDSRFLTYYINSKEFHRELWKRTIHVAFPRKINLGEINHCLIMLPSLNEQQKIATVLTNADKGIELLEQQLADLQQEKKALMQVLLTGKKRVVVDENV